MLRPRVVVVTGASRGVGKAIAMALAPGATVYVTGRTVDDDPAQPEYGVRDVDGGLPASNRSWLGPPTEYGDAVVLRGDRRERPEGLSTVG